MKINKIILDVDIKTHDEAFAYISKTMKEIGIVSDANTYQQALLDREVQGTTGLVDGFAIPHGKGDMVKDAGVLYLRNNTGIEWNSLDGSLITDIFALAIPSDASNHLDTLISISTQLMDKDVCSKLRQATTDEEIKTIFKD